MNTLFLPELREMLAQNDENGLREFCTAIHPAATAEFMEGLVVDEIWRVMSASDVATRAEIFHYVDQDLQLEIVTNQDRQEIAELIAELAPDDRVDLLHRVDADLVDELLSLIPSDERIDILRLRSYPEGTAGAVMTTEVAKLSDDMSLREAIGYLENQVEEFETVYYLYIVDNSDHLRGLVSGRQLISHLSKSDTLLADIMETELITVDVDDDQEEVAQKVARYDLVAIPVVDDQHRMLGIITYDDIIDVVREEATEDAHRIAGMEPLVEGYLQTGLVTLAWKRGVWLVILFFFALLTALLLQQYEARLATWQWMVAFIPLVIASGGNSGNQTAALVITALTTKDVSVKDWGHIVFRELLMGLMLGGFLASCFLVIGSWLEEHIGVSWQSATVVPVTLLLVVICGTILGAILPLLFKKLDMDPALMSNPFVAGLIDILGIVIYLGVATILLGNA